MCEIIGYSNTELLGGKAVSGHCPLRETGHQFHAHAAIAGGRGRTSTLENRYLRTADGRADFSITLVTEISRQERNTERLFEGNSWIKTALTTVADAVCTSEGEGRFVHIKEAFVAFHRFREKNESAMVALLRRKENADTVREKWFRRKCKKCVFDFDQFAVLENSSHLSRYGVSARFGLKACNVFLSANTRQYPV